MRISDWSSDVCSSDLKRYRHIFGAGVLREAFPAGTELEAFLAADDAVSVFAVLGFATSRDDRERRGDVEGGERAFEAAVRLDGEICDGGHDKVSWIDRDHPDGACTRGREPPSPEHRDGEPRMGLTAGGDPRPTEKRPRGVDDRPGRLAAAVIHRLLDKGTCGTARHLDRKSTRLNS